MSTARLRYARWYVASHSADAKRRDVAACFQLLSEIKAEMHTMRSDPGHLADGAMLWGVAIAYERRAGDAEYETFAKHGKTRLTGARLLRAHVPGHLEIGPSCRRSRGIDETVQLLRNFVPARWLVLTVGSSLARANTQALYR